MILCNSLSRNDLVFEHIKRMGCCPSIGSEIWNLVEIKKAKGEGFLSKSAELVGGTNPNEIRTGITFIIEIHGSTKSSINIKSEKVILCGSILIMKGEGEGSRCVRIGGIEIQHSGTDGKIFSHCGGSPWNNVVRRVVTGGKKASYWSPGCAGGIYHSSGVEICHACG